jgi:asparagine synthase (glutamine-hydrolysing)
MCGILGILKQRNSEYYIEDSVIKKMCSSIMHRGPDNSNYWIESGIALGHQRLSVLELSISGNQPMHSTDDRFVIIYIGEIFNHFEIRKKIEYKSNSYIKWNGSSDTETLLESFKVFGILETLTLCSGMFSIALWDKKKKF